MKTIICGTREATPSQALAAVTKAVKESGFVITEVISGACRGIDWGGERWAEINKIPFTRYQADWPTFGAKAGPIRNSEMIAAAEQCIALPRKDSKGTRDTIRKSYDAYGPERVFVYEL